MKVLGVRFDEVTRAKADNTVRSFLAGTVQQMIFTPNPEMLVDATRDPLFLEALNRGALNICDGTGVALMSCGKLKRIPGADFFMDVCQIAEEMGKCVYLLGSEDEGILMNAKNELQKKFPALKIVGQDTGAKLKNSEITELEIESKSQAFQECNSELIEKINTAKPDVLFVAFGHKKQEWWINEFLPLLPSVKVAMGVGGVFDLLGGKLRRAPVIFRRLGIEWVWRLIQEPRRVKRIWKATVTFIALVILKPDRSRLKDLS